MEINVSIKKREKEREISIVEFINRSDYPFLPSVKETELYISRVISTGGLTGKEILFKKFFLYIFFDFSIIF